MAVFNPVIDLFVDELEDKFKPIVIRFRQLITTAHPDVVESKKWGCPFYECFGMLCYINPRKDKVDVGFYRGNELKDTNKLLSTQQGKQVRHYVVKLDENIKEEEFMELLEEAIELSRTKKFRKYS